MRIVLFALHALAPHGSAVLAPVAPRAVFPELAVRTGATLHTARFYLAVRTPSALRAVVKNRAVGTRKALLATALELAVRTRVAL